jgi:hypothetical protein
MAEVTIELEFEDRPKQTKSLKDGKFVIGRDAGDLILGDPLVSGQHAELTVSGDQVKFLDIGSTNGSFFNTTKVTTPIMLSQGEGVKMGNTMLVVKQIINPTATPATPATPATEQSSFKQTFFAPGAPAPQAPAAAPAPAPAAPEAAPAPAPAADVAPAVPAPAPAPDVASSVTPSPPAVAAPDPSLYAPQAEVALPSDQAPLPNPYAGSGGGGAAPPGAPPPSHAAPPPQQALVSTADMGGAAGASFATPDEDPIAYFNATITSTWALYRARFMDFAKMFGIVLVGGTAISSLLALIPFIGLLSIPIMFATYFVMFFGVMGMSAEYCLHLVGGQPITVNEALARQKRRFASSLLSTFLAGLVGWTFVLGVYMFQVQVGERRENFDISGRVFELFRGDWKRIVVTSAIVIVGFIMAGFLVGLIQLAGGAFLWLLGGIIGAVFSAFTWSFFMLLSTRMYYDSRQKVEGVDPIPTVLQTLNSD